MSRFLAILATAAAMTLPVAGCFPSGPTPAATATTSLAPADGGVRNAAPLAARNSTVPTLPPESRASRLVAADIPAEAKAAVATDLIEKITVKIEVGAGADLEEPIALDEQGKITGTVPGAAIEFKGTAVVKATADKYGRYKVDMRPGAYTFTITAAGFKDENQGRQITTKTVPNGYQVQNFSLTVGQSDPKQKPPRVPGIAGFLEGKVATGLLQGEVVEKTADGNEVPIPGATVYLRNTIGQPRLSQATTRMHDEKTKKSRQGHYELELDAGTYSASVVASGFESFKEVEPITIVAGKTTTHRFVLTRGLPPAPKRQGIEGTVTFADPGKTAPTRPAVKLSIVAVPDAGKPAVTFNPDDKGGFRRSLPAGRYHLAVEAKGYRTYPRTIPDVYVLRGAFAKVNVYLVQDLHFYAVVYERVGQGTRPLPGASFELIKSADPSSKPGRLTTDKRGYVSLILDKEGEYVALAQLAGFTAARGVKVSVRANGNNHANIELERSGVALSLHVVEEYAGKKTPLEGAHVTVKGEKSSWGRTSADGRYKVTGLAKGGYAVEVVRKGFKSASTKVFVSNTDLSREIVLTPDMKAFDLTIHTKAGSRPVVGADVCVWQEDAKKNMGSTDGAGSYTARGLSAGYYTVDVIHRGYKPARSPQVIVSDRNVSRDIALAQDTPPPTKPTIAYIHRTPPPVPAKPRPYDAPRPPAPVPTKPRFSDIPRPPVPVPTKPKTPETPKKPVPVPAKPK